MRVGAAAARDQNRPPSPASGTYRVATAVLACGALALILSGCQITSGVQYVSHRSPDGVDLYFKVPTGWSVFDTKQVLEAQNGRLGPTQLKQISGGEWLETMSPRPGVTAKSSLGIGRRYPTAFVQSRELGDTERDDLNFSAMRSEFLPTDPLTATSGYEVLNYNEFSLAGGIHGIKMIVNITTTTPVVTWGQITAVDANTDYIFSIVVGCEASCWGENAGALTNLLDSWTLKEQAP